MLRRIAHELKHHAPFTLGGTVLAIGALVLLSRLDHAGEAGGTYEGIFAIMHALHVLLSAVATAGMYRRYGRGRFGATVLIGYVGAIAVATLSDSVVPYLGELLGGLPKAEVHAGFLENWWLVNPLALGGAAIGYLWPRTELPHAGHVLLSMLASLTHMLAAMDGAVGVAAAVQLGLFLFLAVWVPCCTSDIVFPLLFVKKEDWPACRACHGNGNDGGDE